MNGIEKNGTVISGNVVLLLKNNVPAALILIILLSLMIKIAIFMRIMSVDQSLFLTLDASDYIRLAESITETNTFSISAQDFGFPETIRTPGYPIFIAGVFTLSGCNIIPVIILQILLSLATILMTYVIGLELQGKTTGLLSAALVAMDVLSADYTNRVMAETLFTLLIILLIWLSVKFVKSRGTAVLALTIGLLTAVATHIRPVNYYLVILLFLFFTIIGIMKHWNWSKIVISSLLLFLPSIILVGGWQMRNYRLTGNGEFSHISSVNIYFFRGAGITALKENKKLSEVQRTMDYDNFKKNLWADKQTMPVLLRRWKEEGMKIIKENPYLLLKMQVSGMLSVILRPGGNSIVHILGYDLNELQKKHSNIEIAKSLGLKFKFLILSSIIYLGLLYIGVIGWFVRALKNREMRPEYFILLLVIAYFIFVSGGPEGDSRFRIPVVPIIAVLSSLGMIYIAAFVNKIIHNPRKQTFYNKRL